MRTVKGLASGYTRQRSFDGPNKCPKNSPILPGLL